MSQNECGPVVVSRSFGRGGRGRGNRGGRGGFSGGLSSENDGVSSRLPPGDKEVVSISATDKGALIGRGGHHIRQLQEQTGARIFMLSDEAEAQSGFYQGPGEKNVYVYGTDEQKAAAKKAIFDALGYDKSDDFGQVNAEQPEPEMEIIDWDKLREESDLRRKERWAKCPPLIKEFYKEHPEVTAMMPDEVAAFRRENNNIEVSNFDPESKAPLLNPAPKFHHSFHNFPDILSTINRQGFDRPSPIQAQAWPYLLSGKDLIGIAQTGTGKTLAFLMPCFVHIDNQPVAREERGGPNVLVLSPTRELALQIADEVKKYEYKGIKSVCVYGGGDRRKQMQVVTDGVQIIIATPGRLNDLIEAGCIKVESVTYLILDEADRMLDMGFEPQIRKTMLDIRPDRQTVMTSATWPANVRRLATSYMTDPVTVFIGSLDLAAVHSVEQQLIFVQSDEEKRDILMEFLVTHKQEDEKVIVFLGKKARADDIASDLSLKDIVCQSIHGDREQSDREQAVADLKSGEVKILIATDVASRGIDIQDIAYVFNYDFPRDIEDYVHRVGRTGRAGKTGTAITLIEERGGSDWRKAKELIEILTEAGQEVPHKLTAMAERFARYQERREVESLARANGGGGGEELGQSQWRRRKWH